MLEMQLCSDDGVLIAGSPHHCTYLVRAPPRYTSRLKSTTSLQIHCDNKYIESDKRSWCTDSCWIVFIRMRVALRSKTLTGTALHHRNVISTPIQLSILRQPLYRQKHSMIPATSEPLAGYWKPTHLQGLYYGAGSVERHLLSTLPSEKSKAFIVTGNSLASKTSLIKQVEQLLGHRHAGTFSQIKQHSPVQQLDEILDLILKDESVDTVLSIGGGSPCDSSKALSSRYNEKQGRYLRHVTVPTTLSAAECTGAAGLTTESGLKKGISSPNIVPDVIIYDAEFAVETPSNLLMSTGFRALDHAVELMYHNNVSPIGEAFVRQCLFSASRH